MDRNKLFLTLQTLSTADISLLAPAVILLSLCYLLLVRYLRFRALHKLEKKYAVLLEDPYTMSYKTAQEIIKQNLLNEMPYMNLMAGQFALLKTYGIASGTKLLVQTRQLTSEEKVAKRAEDTGVFITEFVLGDLDSERGMRAIAKVNWLHSRYRKLISNEEMLHTLSVFTFEAMDFINRYEWRSLTQLEKVARFVYWREIGLRMGIRNIPETAEAFEKWTVNYEKDAMVFAESNRICMDTTMELLLRDAPRWAREFLKSAISVFLEKQVLRAVGWPDPPRWVTILVMSGMHLRAWMIRNLFLPRLWSIDPLPELGADGRIYRKQYFFEPWYVKDNIWTRWTTWLASKGNFSPGENFKSNGYLPEEVGPREFETVSKEPVRAQAEAMERYVAMTDGKIQGCPFAFGDELRWR